MEFSEIIRDIAIRSQNAVASALTEEATKTSVIMPMIKALGFDVFDLNEVVPEFISDVGTKKGEKVDYALKINGKLSVLIECKPISTNLSNVQFNQLYRYFSVTDARIAILTNGRELRIFSDVDEPNRMDKKPFFIFDLQSYDDNELEELKKFHKNSFDIEKLISAATNLRYVSSAAIYIKSQLQTPDEDFVKLVGRQIYDGALTKNVIEQLKPAIRTALDTIIRERIQEKLGVALKIETSNSSVSTSQEEIALGSDIDTTVEEHQAFFIVRAIGAKIADLNRITMRDSKSYCSVFIDDNNRKPVCRFYFNPKSVRYLGTFDASKTETKHPITTLSDIYKHADLLSAAIAAYL